MSTLPPLTPDEEAAVDAAFRDLAVLAPPAKLASHVLASALAEMAEDAVQDGVLDAAARALPVVEPPASLVSETRAALQELTSEEAAAEASLSAAVADLPLLHPPRGLAKSTLEAVLAELRADAAGGAPPPVAVPAPPVPPPANRPWRWLVALGAAAAVALLAVPAPDPAVDTSQLVERGVGDRLPSVDLKVAVDQGGQVGRLSRDASYGAGDTLYFRAAVDDQATVTLVRVDAAGATVVHQQRVSPGEADLALGSGPLGWRLEPGEGDAIFAVLATLEPLPAAAVVDALQGAYTMGDPAVVCSAAHALNARCSAELVRVSP